MVVLSMREGLERKIGTRKMERSLHDERTLSPEEILLGATALRDLLLCGERYRRAFAKRFSLGQAEAVAMSHLAACESLSPTQLAEQTGVTQGAVTALLDRLEAAGQVVRVPHSSDRRQSVLKATPQGEVTLAYAQRNLTSALDSLSDVELRRLTVLLRELLVAIRAESTRLARRTR